MRSELARADKRCIIAGSLIVLVCGFLSALAGGSSECYREIVLPRSAPPGFVFPLVWTVLYILIGGAAGIVACRCDRYLEGDKLKGLLLFIIMMVFNFAWYPLFFGAQAFFAALVTVIMMIILSFFAMIFFWRISKTAAVIMGIYILWLLFAAYLNLAVIILN